VAELDCRACGACCQFAVAPPFEVDELANIPADLAGPVERFWAHAANPDADFWSQTGSRMCFWYDPAGRSCTNYDHRPRVCREFEVNGEDCADMRKQAGIDRKVGLTISARTRV
jgi:Fe-S-cluster containining protein